MIHPFPTRWDPYTHPDAPLHWRKPRMVRVAVDLFGLHEEHDGLEQYLDETPDDQLDRIFAVMALCPQHTFFVSTERPGRMREYLTDGTARQMILDGGSVPLEPGYFKTAYNRVFHEMAGSPEGREWRLRNPSEDFLGPNGLLPTWPLPNVVLATTVRTQQEADERIPELLACPAAYRAVEVEPREEMRLDPVDGGYGRKWLCPSTNRCHCGEIRQNCDCPRIDQLILRGGKEPIDLAWLRSLIAQADAAGVPVWVMGRFKTASRETYPVRQDLVEVRRG